MYAGDRQACKTDITSRNMLCLMSAVAEKAQCLRNPNQPEHHRGSSMRHLEEKKKNPEANIKKRGSLT